MPETMPDGLMDALPAASAQPFEADANGYRARSGGLDFTLRASGLQASRHKGAAYPIRIDPLIFLEQKVIASGGAAGEAFGVSVALSGDTALVGADGDAVGTNTDQGSAYFYPITILEIYLPLVLRYAP